MTSIERLALRCLLPGFVGTTAPDWIRRRAAAGLGGAVLYGRNVESAEQLAALTGAAGSTKGDSLLLFYVGMNVKVKPLDNPEVRDALRMAIDYDGIIKDLLSGNSKKVQTNVPAGFFGYNSDAPFQ